MKQYPGPLVCSRITARENLPKCSQGKCSEFYRNDKEMTQKKPPVLTDGRLSYEKTTYKSI